MPALPVDKLDLSDEQKTQHRAIINSALFNLNNIVDGLSTLDHKAYDDVLEHLDEAITTLKELSGQGKTE